LLPQVGAILAILLAAHFGATPLIFLLVAIWALRSHVCAVQSLTLSYLLTFLNPELFPTSGLSSVLRWAVLLSAVLRIFLDARQRRLSTSYSVWALLAFSLTASVTSLMVSPIPAISMMKIASFTLGAAALLTATQLNVGLKTYWKSWFLTLVVVVVFVSVPTYFVRSIGFAQNGRGFQGIINHPQVFAVFLSPMATWLTIIFVTREQRGSLYFVTLLLTWACVFASQARGALVTVTLSILSALIIMRLFQKEALRDNFARLRQDRRAFLSLMITLVVGFSITIASWNSIQLAMVDFLSKGVDGNVSVTERFEKSRGFLIQRSIENFKKSPILGIGFAVPSVEEYHYLLTNEVGGVTLAAPTEKGFLPSATLEENGLLGTFFLLIFFGTMLRSCLRKANFANLCLFFACLYVNLGEMNLFAMGGNGLYLWLMLSVSLTSEATTRDLPTSQRRTAQGRGSQGRTPQRRVGKVPLPGRSGIRAGTV
jgi:heme exporter protein D